jgi:tetratricopeptide (TPR) repeat protein
LFPRLAVFQGGRTLEAIAAVCAGEEAQGGFAIVGRGATAWAALQAPDPRTLPPLKVDVLEGVDALLGHNLLQQRMGLDGETRFWMLETIHEYAREQLAASGEAATLRDRHLACYVDLAEEAEAQLTGPEQAAWLARLEDEHDNLRAALRWAREAGNQRPEAEMLGLRLAGALWRFWFLHGYLSEGRAHLTAALAAAVGDQTGARARALHGAGILAYFQGDYGAARTLHAEALALRRELGDLSGISGSLNNLGIVAYGQGDYGAARALHEEALALRRQLGDQGGIAGSLSNLGGMAAAQADYAEARVLHEEALALRRALGDQWGIAVSLNNLASVASAQGNYAVARALLIESLGLRRELGDQRGIVDCLAGLGEGIADRAGSDVTLLERSARVLGAVAAQLDSLGAVLDPEDRIPYEEHVAALREALGEDRFAQAWRIGQGLSVDAAMAEALGEDAAE